MRQASARRRPQGQGLVEYALLVAMIALMGVAGLSVARVSVTDALRSVGVHLELGSSGQSADPGPTTGPTKTAKPTATPKPTKAPKPTPRPKPTKAPKATKAP